MRWAITAIPSKREAGFVIGMLACGALVAGSVLGLLLQ
jgi:glutathione S-transferase